MRKVITIPEVTGEKKPSKGIEFTHVLTFNIGWTEATGKPKEYQKIVYLGECGIDGDMFAVYSNRGYIGIYKGHLNDGTY